MRWPAAGAGRRLLFKLAGGRSRLFGTWAGRAALTAGIAALLIVVVLLALGESSVEAPRARPSADAVPYDGRSPRQPAGAEQRVLLALQRPALGRLRGVARMDASAQRAYVISLRKEAAALRGALRARGVRLSEVTGFERVWNGFAATVRTRDLAAISSLGVRAQPVRRFYPAVSEPARTGAAAPGPGPPLPPAEQEPVAMLASGVMERGAAIEKGIDVIAEDEDAAAETDPRDGRRREASGTALAGVLVRSGERVRPIRVAALQTTPGAAAPVEEYGTSDHLLAGLERAVDPDEDGDATDRVAVALVAVSAPYAGFSRTPEAEAVRGAAGLGTLVVAPAGNEGRARPPSGTIGSPGAAAAAVTVGALSGAPSVPEVELRAGDERLGDAAVLGGAPPAGVLPRSPTVSDEGADRLLGPGAPRLQGTLAVLRAGKAPGAQAAAASTAGARAVLLAEPRAGRVLPAVPAGSSSGPVLGVTGPTAKAVLELQAGRRIEVGRPRRPERPRRTERVLSPFSSRGPALDGTPKPDLAAAGAARTIDTAGQPVIAGGTAVAAALVAAEAARLARARPEATPAQLKAALTTAAETGEGPTMGPSAARSGAVAVELPPPVGVGPVTLTRRRGRVFGVRFTLGAFDRGDPLGQGTAFQPVERLELELLRADGALARRLTPANGARELLPAEYAYTLPRRNLTRLGAGSLHFRVRARAPRQTNPTERRSASFKTR